jgi:hypothetical protein
MLDPRLQYTQLHTRQQELVEQATGDRLAASQRVNQKALGGLLTTVGTALLALGMRLRGERAPASSQLADAALSPGRRLAEASGHSAEGTAVSQQDGSAAATSTRVALKKRSSPSEACS